MEVQPYLFVLNSAKFWAFFSLFEPFGVISFGPLELFWGRGQARKIFGTYSYSQSTLVLEVQPYLFALTSAEFGAFLPFLGLLGLFLGLGSGSKTFLGPTYID